MVNDEIAVGRSRDFFEKLQNTTPLDCQHKYLNLNHSLSELSSLRLV